MIKNFIHILYDKYNVRLEHSNIIQVLFEYLNIQFISQISKYIELPHIYIPDVTSIHMIEENTEKFITFAGNSEKIFKYALMMDHIEYMIIFHAASEDMISKKYKVENFRKLKCFW